MSESEPVKPRAERSSSFDEETVKSLEKQLAQRPEKSDLVDRNILKDDKVAPALQAARDQLEKSQKHDKMEQAILNRPSPDKLISEGILLPEEAPEKTSEAS